MDYGIEALDESGAGRVNLSGGETMCEVFGSGFALGRGCGGWWEGGLRELPGRVSDIRVFGEGLWIWYISTRLRRVRKSRTIEMPEDLFQLSAMSHPCIS
jgi:hypothetical protein